jgi:8-oxo-dGTP diphosphatase
VTVTSQHYRPNRARVECGAALVLRDHGAMFMIRRTGAHGDGSWSFPGGWVWPGEEPARAAAREAWEEVGVNVSEERMTFLGYTADSHPEGVHGITLWFDTYAWGGKARNTNPARITDCGWFRVSALPTPLFTPVLNGLKKGFV